MKTIGLVIPYIGNLRGDFSFWMKSVANNPTIDFLMFTDFPIVDAPKNLHVYKTTFKDLKNLFQRNFDFELSLHRPYKFCDFRPAYGEIFSEYLSGYDFWGYTDTDMIYGNLRKYLTEDLFEAYDHIFGRGHFSIYRNNESVNREYRNVKRPTYQQVFTYNEGRAFDEYCGTSKHWIDNLPDKFFDAIWFDDIDCFEYPFISQMRRKEYAGCKNTIYSFEDGTLYRIFEKDGIIHKAETMYVHFQKRNMVINTAVSNRFIMIPNSFEDFEIINDVKRLEVLGSRDAFYPQKYRLKWNELKGKFNKALLRINPSVYGYPFLPDDIRQYYIEE